MIWLNHCSFNNLHAAMLLAAQRIESLYAELAVPCVITSANDSMHLKGSKHYKGKALDFRTKNIKNKNALVALVKRIKLALGPQYTVLLEDLNAPNEHLHVQFDGD